MKIYWKLHSEHYTPAKVIRVNHNPIREYEDELIEGAIIDVGCGQSPYLLDFIDTNREIFAFDNEQIQLDHLKKKVEILDSSKLDLWHFICSNFPADDLPKKDYALMIFSNILHFFSLPECLVIGQTILNLSQPGTLIYIGVHSKNFYVNRENNPRRFDYFKHYFNSNDLDSIFPSESFEKVYYAEINKIDSAIDRRLTNKWLDITFKKMGYNDKVAAIEKAIYFKDKSHSDIAAIYRRK